MALIKCPECGKDISDKANVCPHCGYPINTVETASSREAQRLLSKIIPTSFKCPPVRLKVCVKCCSVFNQDNEPYCKCGMPGVEVDYPIQQGYGGDPETMLYIFEHDILPRNIGDKNSKEYQHEVLQIQECLRGVEEVRREKGRADWRVRPDPPKVGFIGLPAGDIDISDFERAFNSPIAPEFDIPSRIPDDSPYNILDEIIATFPPAPKPQPLLPHCPFCHSTNLTKISVAKKAGKTWLFGIFGALDDAGKTYKCNNCGGKF